MNKVDSFTKMEHKDGGIAYSAMICLYIFIVFIGQAVLNAIVKSQSTISIAISALFSPLAMLAVIAYYIEYNRCKKQMLWRVVVNCFELCIFEILNTTHY